MRKNVSNTNTSLSLIHPENLNAGINNHACLLRFGQWVTHCDAHAPATNVRDTHDLHHAYPTHIVCVYGPIAPPCRPTQPIINVELAWKSICYKKHGLHIPLHKNLRNNAENCAIVHHADKPCNDLSKLYLWQLYGMQRICQTINCGNRNCPKLAGRPGTGRQCACCHDLQNTWTANMIFKSRRDHLCANILVTRFHFSDQLGDVAPINLTQNQTPFCKQTHRRAIEIDKTNMLACKWMCARVVVVLAPHNYFSINFKTLSHHVQKLHTCHLPTIENHRTSKNCWFATLLLKHESHVQFNHHAQMHIKNNITLRHSTSSWSRHGPS